MSFAFYSVWKVQNKAYVYSFLMTVGIDVVGLDCFKIFDIAKNYKIF